MQTKVLVLNVFAFQPAMAYLCLCYNQAMIKIAIVEDQEKWIKLISAFLERYKKETGAAFSTVFFADGSKFISSFKGDYQLVFMDVARPVRDGIKASKELRKIDKDVCLVFLTERAQYAVEGYEVNAYDFLIKPMEYDLFKVKRNKFLSHIQSGKDDFLLVNGKNGIHKIKVSEIHYVESRKHYIYFHCEEETYRRRGSLDSLKKVLKENGFSDINRSLVVNLAFVDNYSPTEVVVCKETLPLSRIYKAAFLNDLTKYFGNRQ